MSFTPLDMFSPSIVSLKYFTCSPIIPLHHGSILGMLTNVCRGITCGAQQASAWLEAHIIKEHWSSILWRLINSLEFISFHVSAPAGYFIGTHCTANANTHTNTHATVALCIEESGIAPQSHLFSVLEY